MVEWIIREECLNSMLDTELAQLLKIRHTLVDEGQDTLDVQILKHLFHCNFDSCSEIIYFGK